MHPAIFIVRVAANVRREQVPPASAIYLGVHRELPLRYAQFGAMYTLMTEPIKPSLQNGFVVAKV